MEKVRIGLIGLGFMGTTHFGIYRDLAAAEVVAVADVDPAKRAGDVSKVVGNIGGGDNSRLLDLGGIAVFDDALDLIASPDVDVVDICVPTNDHARYVLAALAAGKHVFCEKPLCRNREEMLAIAGAVRRSPGFFNVGMCIRAWPEYRHARELYRSGAIGRIRTANFTRLSPSVDGNAWENWFMDPERSGGALLDLHLHDTDAVCYFFGRPEAVFASGVKGVVSAGGVDHVVTSYRYGDGALIVAEGGWDLARQAGFEMGFLLVTERATLRFSAAGYQIYWNDGRVETPQVADPALPTGWHRQLAYFVDCVKENIVPDRYQTLEQILDSYAVILAEAKSVESGMEEKVEYV